MKSRISINYRSHSIGQPGEAIMGYTISKEGSSGKHSLEYPSLTRKRFNAGTNRGGQHLPMANACGSFRLTSDVTSDEPIQSMQDIE